MANLIYPKFKETLLGSGVNLVSGTVKVVMVDTGVYTYSAAHQFLSSLTGVVGTALTLTTKTVTNGVFDADDVSFTAVTGASVEAVVIYLDTGSAATSNLVFYLDTSTGLPVSPNGGNINITFDNGANKIFAL